MVNANISSVDEQLMVVSKSPSHGRKPGGASDGEEPEPDGIEAEHPP